MTLFRLLFSIIIKPFQVKEKFIYLPSHFIYIAWQFLFIFPMMVSLTGVGTYLYLHFQACFLCAQLPTTLPSDTKSLPYSMFMKQQQLYAVILLAEMCAV